MHTNIKRVHTCKHTRAHANTRVHTHTHTRTRKHNAHSPEIATDRGCISEVAAALKARRRSAEEFVREAQTQTHLRLSAQRNSGTKHKCCSRTIGAACGVHAVLVSE